MEVWRLLHLSEADGWIVHRRGYWHCLVTGDPDGWFEDIEGMGIVFGYVDDVYAEKIDALPGGLPELPELPED